MLTIVLPQEYIGRLLYLKPVDGSGWRQSVDPESSTALPPVRKVGDFHVRVRYFLTLQKANAWCGVVGTVEQADHLFDRLWISCTVNYQGYPDFTDRLRKCWCRIGPYRPVEPSFYVPSGLPFYEGSGILAESEALATQVFETKALFG